MLQKTLVERSWTWQPRSLAGRCDVTMMPDVVPWRLARHDLETLHRAWNSESEKRAVESSYIQKPKIMANKGSFVCNMQRLSTAIYQRPGQTHWLSQTRYVKPPMCRQTLEDGPLSQKVQVVITQLVHMKMDSHGSLIGAFCIGHVGS